METAVPTELEKGPRGALFDPILRGTLGAGWALAWARWAGLVPHGPLVSALRSSVETGQQHQNTQPQGDQKGKSEEEHLLPV